MYRKNTKDFRAITNTRQENNHKENSVDTNEDKQKQDK